jgi:phosphatidylinositol kinase/protein kinase (PI-3  family)
MPILLRVYYQYEMAQEKARANLLPFGQGEYNLWEDHWVLCASKMQQVSSSNRQLPYFLFED